MPRGVHKSKRPSGSQQRKVKEAKSKSLQKIAGSMLQYVQKSNDSQSSSKDLPQSSSDMINDNSSSMDLENEEAVEMVDCAREEDQEMDTKEYMMKHGEESTESESSQDTEQEENEILQGDLQILKDVSNWKIPVPIHLRTEIIKKGSTPFQNKDGPFGVVSRQNAKGKEEVRQLSKDWFFKEMKNGEKILRSWMVYSLISENLYCFCCRLFTVSVANSTSKFVTGFQKWWKLNPKVQAHEESEEHLQNLEKWKTLAAGLRLHNTIDAGCISLMEKEKKHWRDILYRLLEITLFLAKQNLPFRGHRENESSSNKGNFLELVEMLSKYDVVLKEHMLKLKENNRGIRISYLSPEIQNEFISVLAKHVKEKLVMDIKSAKYFGVMFDSTPDISHTDQMSEVIRYVKCSNGKVEIKEVFLGFFPLKGKTAADLSSDILEKLEGDGLDIMMCRAQGYDNAATMAGIHGGVQAIIKKNNSKAIFNGCIDHTLNLCGQHSFAENASCVTFFGTLESLYTFFAASTHRWDVLIKHTGVSIKRLVTTRWSAHYTAVTPVKEKFDEVVAAIESLGASHENLDTRGAAQCLLPAICNFTFLCYLYFWCDMLREIDSTQQYLQTKGLSIDKVVIKLEALKIFVHEERNHIVENAIARALKKSEEYGIAVEKRVRFKKRMAGEEARDVGLTLQEENKREMLECIDRFYSELQIRSKSMTDISSTFEAIQTKNLISFNEEELEESIKKFTSFYDEISANELLVEIPRLRRHLKAAGINLKEANDWSSLQILNFIIEWDFVESLPNLSLSLKLFLTICVSVASCERSFSKLKLIKSYLRSTMSQSRLSDLALLSIENDVASSIDFDEIIDKFTALKSRKTFM